ncbi:RNA-binding domain-containing protein [Amycolatopsis viridis]|uniref:ATP-dependent DNA helicase RecG n=1 Tax=Amycolatopsis viridis TaxID=185678 RepID=A0ABX0SLZ1_9PSEU|nr:RNA-binding domain-containing protein [Amycolatopsis viridis]NIH78003.1 ATP-dependent DNA helicase RecG [Amycolatopsis viridis]
MTTVLAELKAVLGGRAASKVETEKLDFKEQKSNPKEAFNDLAEAAVCFANGSGGTIVVGVVDNKSGAEAFVGCDLDAAALRSRIHQLTNPGLLVDVEEVVFAEKRLLEIRVPEGLEVYSTTKGYTYQRINTDCMPMRPSDVARLTEERRGIDWSAGSSGRSVDEVDPLAIRYIRRLLSASTDQKRQRYADFNDIDLLRALKAVADDGCLTKSGEILFCNPESGSLDELVVYQHKPTQSGEVDSIVRLQGPAVTAFEELVQLIRTRQGITPVTLPDGQQLQIEDYPSAAVREAVANAFIHGDWRLRVPIQVEHSPQYLRIDSPGPLVSGITVSNILTHGSRARFPALAAGFRILGLAEEVGQGVDRMYREMIRSGRDIPIITEDPSRVSVLFRGQPPKVRIAKFLATLPAPEQNDTDTLLIVRYLCEKKTVRADVIAAEIQRSDEEAQAVLLRLSTDPVNILEPTRGTMNRRFPSYRLRAEVITQLGNAVAYHSRATDDIDKKIIDHINDYGEINNRTIQRLFDLDVYQARDILRDLVGREIISRSSTQKRGTAVKYSAGPKFPDSKRRKKAAGSTGSRKRDDTLF